MFTFDRISVVCSGDLFYHKCLLLLFWRNNRTFPPIGNPASARYLLTSPKNLSHFQPCLFIIKSDNKVKNIVNFTDTVIFICLPRNYSYFQNFLIHHFFVCLPLESEIGVYCRKTYTLGLNLLHIKYVGTCIYYTESMLGFAFTGWH